MEQAIASVTVNRPRDAVYECWRDLDNLPRLLERVESVKFVSEGMTRWSVRGPGDTLMEWDAEIVADRPGELLAWQSLAGSDWNNEGRLEFRDAPGDRGTEVRAVVTFGRPGGTLAKIVGKATGTDPKAYVCEALRRFKQVVETGEGLVSDARPLTAGEDGGRAAQPERRRHEGHPARPRPCTS